MTESEQVQGGLSAERLRLAQAAAQMGIWEWDGARNRRELSPELHDIFGTAADDPNHAEMWARRVHPEDWGNVERFMADAQRSGWLEFDYRYLHPVRGQRWLYCKGRRVGTGSDSRMVGVVLDITDRKQAEEAVRQTDRRFRAIVETTPECVTLVDADGTVLFMNTAGLRVVEASGAGAVVGKSVYDLVVAEDRESFRAFHRKICSGQKGALEFNILTLGGKRRRMEAHAAPLQQPDGHFIQVSITRDITERTENGRLAALLAAIVDSSNDAIVSKSLDGQITSWNKAAERIFGYTAAEAVGQYISLIIPHDRLHEEKQIIERLRRGERIEHFETVRVRKDGELRDISLTISPVKDDEGRIVGASKTARDITARRRAQRRERQIAAEAMAATAKFRAVFEQTTQFAGIMDKEGVVIEANNLSLEGCGYRAEEVLGRPFWQTAWWRNFPESQEKVRAATPLVALGTPYREVLHYSWADGSERLVDFALYPITDSNGEVLFLHPTGVDITETKRNEENYRLLAQSLDAEVRTRTAQLEEQNTRVLFQSEQLRKLSWKLLNLQDDERRRIARDLHDSAGQTLTVLGLKLAEISERSRNAASHLAELTTEAREMVRQLTSEIRTTSYLLHPPLLDESGLPSALAVYIEGLAKRSGLEIRCDIPRDFGRLPQDLELALFRVVQECLTNIHRHSGSRTAAVTLERDTGHVSVRVRDHGRGIPPSVLADIQGTKSGVGIRGMRERLGQYQGELVLESSGEGTTVLITIPVVAELPAIPAAPAPPAASLDAAAVQ